MFQPSVGIGGKIGVFGKDVLGTDLLLQLHQITLFAHLYMQRVKRLHRIELVSWKIALAQWRHAKIHESVSERRLTETTARGSQEPLCLSRDRLRFIQFNCVAHINSAIPYPSIRLFSLWI